MATRVASGIWPLVLIREANSSSPSRHLPLCRLHFPSALATLCDSLNGGWDLFLVYVISIWRLYLPGVEQGISR